MRHGNRSAASAWSWASCTCVSWAVAERSAAAAERSAAAASSAAVVARSACCFASRSAARDSRSAAADRRDGGARRLPHPHCEVQAAQGDHPHRTGAAVTGGSRVPQSPAGKADYRWAKSVAIDSLTGETQVVGVDDEGGHHCWTRLCPALFGWPSPLAQSCRRGGPRPHPSHWPHT